MHLQVHKAEFKLFKRRWSVPHGKHKVLSCGVEWYQIPKQTAPIPPLSVGLKHKETRGGRESFKIGDSWSADDLSGFRFAVLY